MKILGVIGGSGFYEFSELEKTRVFDVETVYGCVGNVVEGYLGDQKVLFIARHGSDHSIPPHKVNYRANIQAFAQLGVSHLVSFNACGGITEAYAPGSLVLPDQIIDYTYGREHTFFDGEGTIIEYVDFTEPFDAVWQNRLIDAAQGANFPVITKGTYGCTQGPRLETSAEIKKLKNDGCDIVGMTLMPEAALAREKSIAYASLSFVVNWAAGVSDDNISLNNIMALLKTSVPQIKDLLCKTVRFL